MKAITMERPLTREIQITTVVVWVFPINYVSDDNHNRRFNNTASCDGRLPFLASRRLASK